MKNFIVSMKKPLWDYQAVLFDMDGTLYSQPVFRLHMGLKLAGYYLFHPGSIKELLILFHYRNIRENWASLPDHGLSGSGISNTVYSPAASTEELNSSQYAMTARRLSVTPDKVQKTVEHWMHRAPLSCLPLYKDKALGNLIEKLRAQSIFTAVYSDYPAADKLAALNLPMDAVFSSDTLGCMKPDSAGMEAILSSLELKPDQVLMVGDRYEKDGLSAKNIGMDYLILPKSMPKRRLLYQKLETFL